MQATKNARMTELIHALRRAAVEHDTPLWKRIAEDLDRPSRERREVNIYHLERNCSSGDVVVVPGKVLGTGELTKDITVAAYDYSTSAKDKIDEVGTTLTIQELLNQRPQGTGVTIIG